MEYTATIFYILSYFILTGVNFNLMSLVKGEHCPLPRDCISELQCSERIQLISQKRLDKIILYGCRNDTVCCIRDPRPPTLHQPRILINLEKANLLPPHCGVDYSYLYAKNESYAVVDEFPWVVLINITDKNNDRNRFVFCGGVLIHESYVLTTAHCIHNLPDAFKFGPIIFGEHNLMTEEDCYNYYSNKTYCAPPIQLRYIEKYFTHENYSKSGIIVRNDIALIKLNEKVNFNRNVQPACLPINCPEEDPDKNYTVAGWGKPSTESPSVSILQKAQLSLISLKVCNEYLDIVKEGMRIDNTLICAASDISVDACKGNSGGPLLQRRDYYKNKMTRWHLIGLVSHRLVKCSENSPTLFTNVEEYIDWILNKI